MPQLIAQTIKTWQLPSLAVAVVHKGKVIFKKAEGLKSIDSNQKVDANTLYRIASGTKTLTAVLLLKLEEAGFLKVDDKITKYIPELLFHSEHTTKNLTLRDIISQRIGISPFSLDPLWVLGTPVEQIIKSFKLLPQVKPFGSYSYQNIAFGLLGIVIERAVGKPYHDVLNDYLLTPLEMDCTTADPSTLAVHNSAFANFKNRIMCFFKGKNWQTNIAYPHTIDVNNQVIKMDFFLPLYTFPATSGAATCLNDAIKWLQFVLEPASMLTTQHRKDFAQSYVQIPLQKDNAQYPHERFRSSNYGFGCFIYEYGTDEKSTKVYVELGAYAGNMFFMAWCPEYDIGIVTMSNLGGLRTHFGNQTLTYKFLDIVLGLPTVDWDTIIKQRMYGLRKRNNEASLHEKLSRLRAAKSLDHYTGDFSNALYGDLTFSIEDDHLVMHYKNKMIPLTHWNNNRFSFNPTDLSPSYAPTDTAYVEWHFGAKNKVLCYIPQLSQPIIPNDNRFFEKK